MGNKELIKPDDKLSKAAEKYALENVCPNTMETTTPYEINMVKKFKIAFIEGANYAGEK